MCMSSTALRPSAQPSSFCPLIVAHLKMIKHFYNYLTDRRATFCLLVGCRPELECFSISAVNSCLSFCAVAVSTTPLLLLRIKEEISLMPFILTEKQHWSSVSLVFEKRKIKQREGREEERASLTSCHHLRAACCLRMWPYIRTELQPRQK